MEKEPIPRGRGLTEEEKGELKRLIDAGRPLPGRYRSMLFDSAPLPDQAPEIIWPGKGRPSHPPPVLPPRLDERLGARGQAGPGEGGGSSGSGWRNKLFLADNRLLAAALLQGPLQEQIKAAGGIKLIYIDPPFDVGSDFSQSLAFGEPSGAGRRTVKTLAYSDNWGRGRGSYLSMMYERLRLLWELLDEGGALYLHCDWRAGSALRLLLDEIFGAERFVNEIIWYYYNKYSAGTRCLPRAHDTIWVYSKSGAHTMNELRHQREKPVRQLVRENVGGVLKNARDAEGRLRFRTVHDKKGDDVWRIPQLQPASAQWSGFGTQKHHDLLERIIRMGSNEGDLVADLFCGSGTTLAAAQRLGRRWLGCDQSRAAIHTSRKRLLGLPGSAGEEGFDLLGLEGEEELLLREMAAETGGGDPAGRGEGEADGYGGRILTAFGARPTSGGGGLEGELGAARVMVESPPAPAGRSRMAGLLHTAGSNGRPLIALMAGGMGPEEAEEALAAAERAGIKLELRFIPREVTHPSPPRPGALWFPYMARFQTAARVEGLGVALTLTGFHLHHHDRQPPGEEAGAAEGSTLAVEGGLLVRLKVSKKARSERTLLTAQPLDWVDYWAVDFDPEGGASDGPPVPGPRPPFRPHWQAFRTWKRRGLTLETPLHQFPRPGSYPLTVQVIDVFGTEWRRRVTVEVGMDEPDGPSS